MAWWMRLWILWVSKRMRAKHIFLPIAAALLLGFYAIYSNAQKAKFDSELWKQAHFEDVDRDRKKLLSPLMVHVLKFGMRAEDVSQLLGTPDEERRGGSLNAIGAPEMTLVYKVNYGGDEIKTLTLDFSHKMKLIDFYMGNWPQPILF